MSRKSSRLRRAEAQRLKYMDELHHVRKLLLGDTGQSDEAKDRRHARTDYANALEAHLRKLDAEVERLVQRLDEHADEERLAFGLVPPRDELLAVKPGYLCRFATSLIRVAGVGKAEIGFYSQTDYDAWAAERAPTAPSRMACTMSSVTIIGVLPW